VFICAPGPRLEASLLESDVTRAAEHSLVRNARRLSSDVSSRAKGLSPINSCIMRSGALVSYVCSISRRFEGKSCCWTAPKEGPDCIFMADWTLRLWRFGLWAA